MRDFPPARTPDFPRNSTQYSGASGDAHLAAAAVILTGFYALFPNKTAVTDGRRDRSYRGRMYRHLGTAQHGAALRGASSKQ